MYEVDYEGIVDELWKSEISSTHREDMKAKVMMSNVHIGLVEEGTNKCQKSLVFDSLAEALYHQTLLVEELIKPVGFMTMRSWYK